MRMLPYLRLRSCSCSYVKATIMILERERNSTISWILQAGPPSSLSSAWNPAPNQWSILIHGQIDRHIDIIHFTIYIVMIYVVDIFVLKRNLSSGINSCYLPSSSIIMRLCSQLNQMQSIFISFTLLSSYVFLFLPSLLLPSPLLFSSLISCSSINCSPHIC